MRHSKKNFCTEKLQTQLETAHGGEDVAPEIYFSCLVSASKICLGLEAYLEFFDVISASYKKELAGFEVIADSG